MFQFINRSLRRQLIAGVALIHALMMSIFVFDLIERQKAFLFERQLEQTRIRAENLAVAASAWVLSRDYAGMAELISIQKKDPEIRYVMLVSLQGQVLAHNDEKMVGRYLSDPTSLNMLKGRGFFWSARSQELSDGAAPIRINQQIIGWARVGLSEQATLSKLNQVGWNGILYTLVAIILGSLLALLSAGRLTRRLDILRQTMENVRTGDTEARVQISGEDEAASLAQDFNTMLDRLAEREHDLHATRLELAHSEARFDIALRGANIGLWDWDLTTNTVFYSPLWKKLRGYTDSEIGNTLQTWEQTVHPDDIDRVYAALHAYLQGTGSMHEIEYRVHHKNGHYIWILDRAIAMRDATGKAVRMIGINADISDRKKLEADLYEEKEQAQVTLASIGDAVITTDTSGYITFMNRVAEDLTGWTLDDARGQPAYHIMTLINEETGANIENPIERCRRELAITGMEEHTSLISRNGQQYAIEDSAAPIFNHSHELIGTVMVFHDVTEKRALNRQMAWQVSHDMLTGLGNRYAFETRLKELESSKTADTHACLYIDLDQFKLVNDISGHAAGDELLRQLGALMQDEIRQADLLARLGGDEFGILLDRCPAPRAMEIAENLRNTISEFRFAWEDKFFDVGASIGVVMFTSGAMSATSIMATADMACYEAKNKGRNRVHLYSPEDDMSDSHKRELEAAAGIRAALKENRLALYAQEIRPVTGGPSDYEILVRFIDELGNIKPPSNIIQAAERFGLMGEIDRWVVHHSFAAFTSTQLHSHFSINLSGHSLTDDSFAAFIRETLQTYPLDTSRICFEITETAAIAHLTNATRFIQDMKSLGFSFALDDFGSGMSSFAYLKHLPIDYIKIDGLFVRDIATDPLDRAFVQSIHHIGRVMGKKTIAEFVENEEILNILRDIGVDYVQGYGIGLPTPLAQLPHPNNL